MKIGIRNAVAVALVLALAGCGASPKQKIAADCVKGGNTKEACKCFVQALGTQLTDKQMAILSKGDKNGNSEQAMNDLGMQGATIVMGAAKKCNMTGAPGGMQ